MEDNHSNSNTNDMFGDLKFYSQELQTQMRNLEEVCLICLFLGVIL